MSRKPTRGATLDRAPVPGGTPGDDAALAAAVSSPPARRPARVPAAALVVLGATLLILSWVSVRGVVDIPALAPFGSLASAVLPAALACWLALGVQRRTDLERRDRIGWLLLGGGAGAAALVASFALLPGSGQDTSMAAVAGAVANVAALSLLLAGLLTFVRRRSTTATMATVLDLAVIAVLAWAVSSAMGANTMPWTMASHEGRLDAATMLLVPGLSLLVLVASVAIFSGVGRQELRGAEMLAALGATGVAATELLLALRGGAGGGIDGAWQEVVGTLPATSVVDLGWTLGFLAVAFGGAVRRAEPRVEHHVPVLERSLTWELLVGLLPFGLLAGAILAWRITSLEGSAPWAAGVIVFLLLARCGLVAATALGSSRGASIDPLTGASNHRHFQERLPLLVAEARALGEPLALAMCDVDDFSLLNDAYSHAEGDRFLRELAYVARKALAPRDELFRAGGDEFAVTMPDTTAAEARERMEEVARGVARLRTGSTIAPSLTIGIAVAPGDAGDAHDLVQLASGTLYWAKLSGKGRVTSYDPETVTVLSAEERVQAMERGARLRAVLALARALDARDSYTARHSEHVARYATAIAEQLGWRADRMELLRVAGLLHDIGKIGVRDSTLRKPSQLTAEEWDEMQRHPVLGARMVEGVAPDEIVPWIMAHHERWDGAGYPHGAAGERISDGARVLAVADTFDAMTSSRSYRAALPAMVAITEIVDGAGAQFDPEVVRAFLAALRARTIDIEQIGGERDNRDLADAVVPRVDHGDGEAAVLDPEFASATLLAAAEVAAQAAEAAAAEDDDHRDTPATGDEAAA